ncbi:hypothetical protein [Methanimicrococcus hongohii]|nr:hypothetical protein [Methanimicrococcus sp. Hf6]
MFVCSWRVVFVSAWRAAFIEKSLTRFFAPPRASCINFSKK